MPWSSTSFCHAATAPGTVTACGESGSIATPFSRYHAASAAAGLRPEPSIATGTEAPLGAYSAKQSPPMPVISGSTTHCTATAAIAASTALPPARRVSIATSVEAGCEVATAACAA